jgi:hypothetical protein
MTFRIFFRWRQQSFSAEEKRIVPDQPFKLAILLGNNEFYVAFNGEQLTSFLYDDDVEKILNNLNVLEILTASGLQFDVQAVDYMRIHPDHWPSYETFNR